MDCLGSAGKKLPIDQKELLEAWNYIVDKRRNICSGDSVSANRWIWRNWKEWPMLPERWSSSDGGFWITIK